jgi:hypothetical protein
MTAADQNPYESPATGHPSKAALPSPVWHRLGYLILTVSTIVILVGMFVPMVKVFNEPALTIGAFGVVIGFLWLVVFSGVYAFRRMRFTNHQLKSRRGDAQDRA